MDRRGVRRGADRYRVRPGGQTARRGKNVREGRWLKRLLVFLALLDLGLLARNYFPAEAAALRTRVLGERDFKAVFADLGRALDQEGGVAETFAAFWGASAEPTPTPTPVPTTAPAAGPPPPGRPGQGRPGRRRQGAGRPGRPGRAGPPSSPPERRGRCSAWPCAPGWALCCILYWPSSCECGRPGW
mgnify:CR=1 FL=1